MNANLQMSDKSKRDWFADLDSIVKRADKTMIDRIKEMVVNIHRRAVMLATVGDDYGGTLKQSIRMAFGEESSVHSTAKHSPYVEFGTGGKVSVPEELRNYAMQFKGKGIKKINLPARPFFYPAVFIEREAFLKFWEKYKP